jgi:hypothetical protein
MRKPMFMALACFLLVPSVSKAQYYYYNDKFYESPVLFEAGFSAGIMNCFTDLGGKKGIGKDFIKDMNWKNAKASTGIYALAMWRYAIAARLEASFGSVQAYDSILKPVAPTTFGRYERNLSFKSRVTEIQLALEIHPLYFKNYTEENEPPYLSPYLLGGIGYFRFDPETKYRGNWYALQPLRTEGQGFKEYPDRKPYKLNQLNLVAGGGIKYEINHFLNARIEIVHRFLFTDYLDDVSIDYIDPAHFGNNLPAWQANMAAALFDRRGEIDPAHTPTPGLQRGDPEDNDSYFTIQLKLGFVLGRHRR